MATAPPLPSIEDLEAAGLTLADLEEECARDDFGEWLPRVSPLPWRWDWPHLKFMRNHLDRVTRGECNRLIFSCPPQHGKTEHNTVRYSAWRMERDPKLRIGVACYDQKQAKKYSRKIRKIVRSRKVSLSKERQAVEEWETRAGGYLKAVGVGSGIAGNPIDILQIDDPVKSREEAESPAYRERVWGWYAEDLYTRLQKDAAIILTMTRWHEDDVVGRIMNGPDAASWEVVNLPAEAEEGDPLGRVPGAPLCPDRFDTPQLEGFKRTLGPGYHALYQGRPVPREGAMIQAKWLERKVAAVPPGCPLVRYWDKAATQGGGKYSAGVLMGKDQVGLFYVADVVRGQWSAGNREQVIRETAESDALRYGHVTTYTEQEPGSGGKESAEATVRNLAGFDVRTDRPTGDKAVRLLPFAAQAEAGNVRIVVGPWNGAYVAEMCLFPSGKFSDQADGTSGSFNKLARAESKYERGELLVL